MQQIFDKARRKEDALLVIFDEAHVLEGEALTDIRLLTSFALDDAPPLKVVLADREPLRRTQRQLLHAVLLSRIAVRQHLAALTKAKTATCTEFHINRIGGPSLTLCFPQRSAPLAGPVRRDRVERRPHGRSL